MKTSQSVRTTPLLRLARPADLLAAIPYLLGFHPAASLVVAAVRAKHLVSIVRADLPTAGAPADQPIMIAKDVVRAIARQRLTGVLLIGYGESERITPVTAVLEPEFERCRIPVLEVLHVSDGRYRSARCHAAECCPPEGIAYDPSTSAVAAAATMAGMVALPDRS